MSALRARVRVCDSPPTDDLGRKAPTMSNKNSTLATLLNDLIAMADAKAEGNLRIVRQAVDGHDGTWWFVGFYGLGPTGYLRFAAAAQEALRIGPRKPEPAIEPPRAFIEVAPAEAAYKAAPSGSKHTLPEDYQPTAELVAQAKHQNPDMTDEAIAARTMAFKNHYLSEGTAKSNWNFAWLGFIGNTRPDERH
jgi:hypothetical protein